MDKNIKEECFAVAAQALANNITGPNASQIANTAYDQCFLDNVGIELLNLSVSVPDSGNQKSKDSVRR